MKRISFLFILIILISSSIYSQSTVTGKVTAESDGLGLPGVNILVQGIVGSGTITDYDGNYSIEVPENATHLQYSFIGMRSEEVEISGRSIINLVMVEESELLEGVIVTAIGIKVEKKINWLCSSRSFRRRYKWCARNKYC
jgi:carboxypeptidase-like protein